MQNLNFNKLQRKAEIMEKKKKNSNETNSQVMVAFA